MKVKQKGLTVLEILILIVAIGLLGVIGWQVYDHQKSMTVTQQQETKTVDPYQGWKTYTSNMGSGISFKYPADWYFPEADTTTSPFKNNFGGSETDHILYSVKPTFSKPIPEGGVSTNQYLCISIDEYTSKGWDHSKWQTSKPVREIPLTFNGKTVNFGLFAGSSPMLSELYIDNPSHPSGDHFITTKVGYVVSINAAFNHCQQSGGEAGIKNLQADFMQQPEVKTAELIIQSIKY